MAAGPYGCRSCGASALACPLADTDGPGCNSWVASGAEVPLLHSITLPPAPRSIVLSADIGTACNQIHELYGDDLVEAMKRSKPNSDSAYAHIAEAMKPLMEAEMLRMNAREIAFQAALAKPFAPTVWIDTGPVPGGGIPRVPGHPDDTVDPLDVEYDGLTLRFLLSCDEYDRHEVELLGRRFTPAQRAAVSAHWSAQLRAKVDAAKQAERNVVTYCELDPDD